MNARVFAVAFAFILAACAHAQLSDPQIVNNAFPGSLLTGKGFHERFSTFVPADLNHSGETLLVSLYTNGTRARLQVVDRSGHVLAVSQVKALKGTRGELELVDLDHDGMPEIIVHLYSGHGANLPDSWVFARRNNSLALVSPMQTVQGNEITELGQTAAVDLNGDGKQELLAFPGVTYDENGKRLTPNTIVYAYSGGTLQRQPVESTFVHVFGRRTSKPGPATQTFASSPGATTLHVANGQTPATSVHVTLNEKEVVSPNNLNEKIRSFSAPVTLASQNTLTVELEGKPGATIWITVDGPSSQ